MSTILSVRNLNLSVTIGDKKSVLSLLSNVSFDIKEGETRGLIGETGCGKTLTTRCIMRLLPARSQLTGEIIFQGDNIVQFEESKMVELRRNKIALIPQNPMTALDPLFTIRQQMYEIIGSQVEKAEKEKICQDVLARVELNPTAVLGLKPYELSGGMLQRVLISMALARKPSLIVADEVTTALDILTQAKLLTLLELIHKEEGISMIIVTHDMKVAKRLCDRMSVMYVGRIIESGITTDVLKEPKHPYTQALLKSIPTVQQKELQPIAGVVPSMANLPSGCKFRTRCPFEFEYCKQVEPRLLDFGNSNVACHLYNEKKEIIEHPRN